MAHAQHGALSPFELALTLSLGVVAWLYVRGWLRLRGIAVGEIPVRHAASVLAGLFVAWVAVGSPLARLDHQWLTAHMTQHLLLVSVAAPLIWWGQPFRAMRHGSPRQVSATLEWICSRRFVRRVGHFVAHPVLCWLVATITLLIWHVPAVLTLTMRSPKWHLVQHASFLVAGLWFWWPIARPWPSAPRAPAWSMVLYLFLATLPCDALSGFLVFSDRVVYPIYLATSGRSEASVLEDQQTAGALMWTLVTIVYLVAAASVCMRCLSVASFDRRDRQPIATRIGRLGRLTVLFVCVTPGVADRAAFAQAAPPGFNEPWRGYESRSPIEVIRALDRPLTIDPDKIYSLAELIDLAQSYNPETRATWEQARAAAGAVVAARSELYPTLAAAALGTGTGTNELFGDIFIRQNLLSSAAALDLNYLICDAGGRAGRIDTARAELLAANFAFTDTHRRIIYQVSNAYYTLLDALGQEDAAKTSLASAQAVQRAAEDRLQQGLATLPDLLEARSATAQAQYELQAVIGAEQIARGDLTMAIGARPAADLQAMPRLRHCSVGSRVPGSFQSRAKEVPTDLVRLHRWAG